MVNLLVCLIYKLNLIISIYVQEQKHRLSRAQYDPQFQTLTVILEHSPMDKADHLLHHSRTFPLWFPILSLICSEHPYNDIMLFSWFQMRKLSVAQLKDYSYLPLPGQTLLATSWGSTFSLNIHSLMDSGGRGRTLFGAGTCSVICQEVHIRVLGSILSISE